MIVAVVVVVVVVGDDELNGENELLGERNTVLDLLFATVIVFDDGYVQVDRVCPRLSRSMTFVDDGERDELLRLFMMSVDLV